jgi:Phytanoyl-CoA dioxygenase (PhyH)
LTKLTVAHRNEFIKAGVLIRKSCVPLSMLEIIRNKINNWFQYSFDASRINEYTQTTFAPDLRSDESLLAIFNQSALKELASLLLSPARLQSVATGQVQIRLPDSEFPLQPEKSMHVDGVSCPHLDPAELRTFTLLVGVIVTPVELSEAGALRYLPGAHHKMAKWFREEWTPASTDQVPKLVGAMEGIPFTGSPGDAIIMHHLIPHSVGINQTPTPRVMVYFRVKHEDHDRQKVAALKDPWLEFPGLRSATTRYV